MDEDLDISDITSLASSLLYEGGNKSSKLFLHKNLRKFNSLTSNFLPLLGWVPRCSPPLHLVQTWSGASADADRFEERVNFSPQQWPYFGQLGHCYIWRESEGGIVIAYSWDVLLMMTMIMLLMIMVKTMMIHHGDGLLPLHYIVMVSFS